MKNCAIASALALVSAFSAVTTARAEEGIGEYADKGSVEIGGAISTSWTSNLFTFDIDPTLGFFVIDNLELSLIVNIGYENRELTENTRVSFKHGAALIEPSYHFPIERESLFVFTGLGIGPGYDGQHAEFELVPRVGLNIHVGGSGILSPALRVPILFGHNKGPGNDDFGVLPGFGVEIGITTTL